MKRSTLPDTAYWEILKSKKTGGKQFRRHYNIGSYILGFFCPFENEPM
jgi:very-short-patch-repair endonuclease